LGEIGSYEQIFYFNEEGKVNFSKTAELSIQKAIEEGIKKILVFTSGGKGALELKERVGGEDIHVIAVSFPNLMPFFEKEEDGGVREFYPDTSFDEVKTKLENNNIQLVQGAMPFEDVIVPGARDAKMRAMKEALNLVSGGLKLCVQAVLMATDNGAIKPGENVVAMSADTSILTIGSNSTFLFHPSKGLQIGKIICKPM